MGDREKLIELLKEACRFDCSSEHCKFRGEHCVGKYADHLLANGVAFVKDTNVPGKVETNVYDIAEVHHNCTVQILRNSVTGEQSIGWWYEEQPPKEV